MSAKAPRISVLIPTRDRIDYLPRTLASVYAQTRRDFEIVVFDDASTDGTGAWIAAHLLPRLLYLRGRRNRGPAAARNAALAAARGEFAAFLDSDDLWEPDYLAVMTAALEAGPALAACCDVTAIDACGRLLARRFLRSEPFSKVPGRGALPFFPLLSATVMRRGALAALGGFDEHFRHNFDDTDLFYRLIRRHGAGSLHFVRRSLVRYRRHRRQITGKSAPGSYPERALDVAYFSAKHLPRRDAASARACGAGRASRG